MTAAALGILLALQQAVSPVPPPPSPEVRIVLPACGSADASAASDLYAFSPANLFLARPDIERWDAATRGEVTRHMRAFLAIRVGPAPDGSVPAQMAVLSRAALAAVEAEPDARALSGALRTLLAAGALAVAPETFARDHGDWRRDDQSRILFAQLATLTWYVGLAAARDPATGPDQRRFGYLIDPIARLYGEPLGDILLWYAWRGAPANKLTRYDARLSDRLPEVVRSRGALHATYDGADELRVTRTVAITLRLATDAPAPFAAASERYFGIVATPAIATSDVPSVPVSAYAPLQWVPIHSNRRFAARLAGAGFAEAAFPCLGNR